MEVSAVVATNNQVSRSSPDRQVQVCARFLVTVDVTGLADDDLVPWRLERKEAGNVSVFVMQLVPRSTIQSPLDPHVGPSRCVHYNKVMRG